MDTLPTSRKQARGLGSKYYFTGIPCKRGHVSKRYASNGTCKVCGDSEVLLYRATERGISWQKERDAKYYGTIKGREVRGRAIKKYMSTENGQRVFEAYKGTKSYHRCQSVSNIKYARGKGKLAALLRARLRSALKGRSKVGSFVRDLGCSIGECQKHLESHQNWKSHFTWENWGTVWELDHIEALGLFDLTDREQFLKAAHYTNLQPLSIEDHKEKTLLDKKMIWGKRNEFN